MPFKLIAPRHTEHVEEYRLEFTDTTRPGSGWSFACDKEGNPLQTAFAATMENLRRCQEGIYPVTPAGIIDYSRDIVIGEERRSDCCNAVAYFSRHCGAWICDRCSNHDGLARCFCGWSASGGNGRRELAEMGESLDDNDRFFYNPEAGW